MKKNETPAGSSTPTAGDGTISYGYDRMSRLTGVDYSDTTQDVTRTYDLAGRPQTMVDGSGTATYTFDNADRLTDIVRSGANAGLNGTFHYVYDDAGDITGRTYPDSTATTQVFDDDGRLTSVTSASLTTSFGYDAAGNLTTTTLPSGNGYVGTRTFDRAGRLTTVENNKSGTILSKFLWTLDAAGNPTKAQTTRGATDVYDAYEYDTRNRLTGSCFGVSAGATNCTGAANAISYAYDKVSNRTQEVRSGNVGNTGTIDSAYNASDQLTSTTKSGQPTNYTYDANGNQASIGSRTFAYDLADRLTSTALDTGSATTVGKTTTGGSNNKLAANLKSGNKVTLSTQGRFTKISANLDGLGTGNGSQSVRALIYADSSGSPGALKAASAQVTIVKGQLRNWFDFTISPAVTLPPGDYWLVLHSGTTANVIRRWGDTVTGAERNNTDTYSDGAADPFGATATGNWSWSTNATYTPVSNATYSYDGDNRRVSSTGTADLRYVWDELADSGIPELTLERTPSGGLARSYLDGPLGATSFLNSSARFYYHQDPLGTVTDVTNATGLAQWKYEYEGYGAAQAATNVSGTAPTNPVRFAGAYLDTDTSQYHLRARQYDPGTGRFGALDALESSMTAPYEGAYVYVGGEPTRFRDPLGLLKASNFNPFSDYFGGKHNPVKLRLRNPLKLRLSTSPISVQSPVTVAPKKGAWTLGACLGGSGTIPYRRISADACYVWSADQTGATLTFGGGPTSSPIPSLALSGTYQWSNAECLSGLRSWFAGVGATAANGVTASVMTAPNGKVQTVNAGVVVGTPQVEAFAAGTYTFVFPFSGSCGCP